MLQFHQLFKGFGNGGSLAARVGQASGFGQNPVIECYGESFRFTSHRHHNIAFVMPCPQTADLDMMRQAGVFITDVFYVAILQDVGEESVSHPPLSLDDSHRGRR